MPWEKSFDEARAVEQAMQVFWEKGYESASIADLIERTGVNRGSLYNAFGGKRALFVKALLKYDQENRRTLLAELEALDDPTRAISQFFEHVVAETVADPYQKGCFVINTAAECAQHDVETRKIVTQGLRETEGFFRRCIEVAQARGDVANDINAADVAKGLFALLVSIRVLGRGTVDEASLRTIAQQADRMIGLS